MGIGPSFFEIEVLWTLSAGFTMIYSLLHLHVVDRDSCTLSLALPFVYLLLTLFSFQQIGDAKTKITEDVTADKSKIRNGVE